MDSRARDLIGQGDKLFGNKRQLDSLWQEIALNFYPERADFTTERSKGEEFSDHLYSSYPSMARRELGNMMAASMRPRSQQWFTNHVEDVDLDKGHWERSFLEHLTKIQRIAMYSRRGGFVRITNQCDHDFAAFGQGVIKTGVTRDIQSLQFNNYHLRDCAWLENDEGIVDCIHRNEKVTAKKLYETYMGKVSQDVKKAYSKDPGKEFSVRHIVMPKSLYRSQDGWGEDFEYTSFAVELEAEHTLGNDEEGLSWFPYTVPRWGTVSGSQYAYSMATSICLPDGRTTQVIMRTLREAGEKYVDPPMVSVDEAVRGDYGLYAGGITTVDAEYDERQGEVLRPITQNSGGMPIGFEIAAALREDIRGAFFLDKIQLPDPATGDMTAYETRKRIEEHIRAASPVWEPIEQEYNTNLCHTIFQTLQFYGAFPMGDMPDSLRGLNVKFEFRSPLADMADAQDAAIWKENMNEIWLPMLEIDPAQKAQINFTTSTRDAARAGGWKETWFNDEKDVEKERERQAQQAEMQAQMEAVEQAGVAAEQGGKGAQEVMKVIEQT